MQMSHQDFVDRKRHEAGDVARKMLSGEVDYLEGAIELSSLLRLAELDDTFTKFATVSSEIDSLPIGEVRRHWSQAALEKLQPEIEEATAWAKELSLSECERLAKEHGN